MYMKLNERQLRKIISETLINLLKENNYNDYYKKNLI